jgi:hypothetical protein
MRPVFLLVLFVLVLIPTLLTLFQPGKPLVRRVSWALWVFASPALLIALIQVVPELNGQALTNANLWTVARAVLTAAAFILPWLLFAASRGR